jgi:hypothetical protein
VAIGMMMHLEWAGTVTTMISPEKKSGYGAFTTGHDLGKIINGYRRQYVEVQSGRVINQSAETSVSTPFKHRLFSIPV